MISPPAFGEGGLTSFADKLNAALDGGSVSCVQLRLKGQSSETIMQACDKLLPIARSRDVAFILNDDPYLAARAGCDGVHVGQDDMSCKEARKVIGDNCIVGVTCKSSRQLAFDAGEQGADYVAFGSFYTSNTKEQTSNADIALLSWWQEIMTLPCVAIGGITVKNCGSLIDAGADFLAVSEGVWAHPEGPAHAVKLFNKKLEC